MMKQLIVGMDSRVIKIVTSFWGEKLTLKFPSQFFSLITNVDDIKTQFTFVCDDTNVEVNVLTNIKRNSIKIKTTSSFC